ncbi:transcription factor, MBF1 [Thioploca ingrica]|uniref:Transcription factor, MBF1 n=1 Tax=Thioploca ingrica TaxID=40754 RepID=A0A090ABR7_9GAMM|nr:transcription factor, MBF1 [Thioploca ingrica]
MEISERIKFMRIFKGWSQDEMAAKLHMAVSGYAKIERGETDIPFSRLKQIANTFQMELSHLIGLNEKNIFNVTGTCNNTHDNSSAINIYPCEAAKLQHENEKLQIIIEQKDKEMALLQQQIIDLREVISLLRKEE